MGVGVGGDYPLSAVISSEFASTKIRGRMMTAVFASQGWGNFGTFHLTVIIISHSNPLPSRCSCLIHCYCCLQRHHPRFPISCSASRCRCCLASLDWSRMRTRSCCTLLPSHHSRNSSFHYGYRA